MTRYLDDNSAVSESAWESVMFAAINAGLSQGIFGRDPKDMGTMICPDDQLSDRSQYSARYEFQHAGLVFQASVRTHFGGAELVIDVWVPSEGMPPNNEGRCGSRLKHGFDLLTIGWIEREKGFYLDYVSGDKVLQARRDLRTVLKEHPVRVKDFWVRRPGGYSNSRRNHA